MQALTSENRISSSLMGHLAYFFNIIVAWFILLFKLHVYFLITSVTGAIKTYYKTLKAKSKRVLTRVRREGLP